MSAYQHHLYLKSTLIFWLSSSGHLCHSFRYLHQVSVLCKMEYSIAKNKLFFVVIFEEIFRHESVG